MITREFLEKCFEDKKPYSNHDEDHSFKAMSLLRERIPYDKCKNIIGGAEHDALYLCDVEDALPYLTEEDANILADCNCWIDEDVDSLALFV